MKLRTIIIDDEPLAQKGLEDHINETGFLELAGKAEDPIEALELLTSGNIDIVFLDIEMPKMSGITFLENLKVPPIVIICSAYAEYALKSFELDVLDYLLKPVTFERFTKAVVKAKEYYELKKNGKQEIYLQSDYFFVKCNQKIEKINFADVNYLEAMGNYVTIHTKAKKFITYLTLKGIEEYLPKDSYVRIHKSYLVPIDKIQSIDENDIKVADTVLPVSRNYKEELNLKINRKLIKRN
ncbi:MAG: LytTR family DNA-binding domain-containing protein [Chitinophagaceae bacterium]|nr:LytTR family DNA-binding domain-containing protein [Chitinophagaceae bacterium]